MTIQQIVDEQMREFDKQFVAECPTRPNKGKEVLNPMFPEPIKSFLSSYTRKLIEAVGEELIEEDEMPLFSERYKCKNSEEKALRKRGRNELRDIQRLKLKEIINSLK